MPGEEVVENTVHVEGELKDDPFAKWVPVRLRILLVVSCTCMLGPFSGSAFMPALTTIVEEFDATALQVYLSIGIGAFVLGVSKIVWGPISDKYSRKWTLVGSLLACIVTAYLQSLSRGMWALIIARAMWCFPVSAMFILNTGMISDTWPPDRRGFAMGIRALPMLVVNVVSSSIGGALVQLFGWRSVPLVTALLSTFFFLLNLFLVPETLDKTKTAHLRVSPLEPLRLVFTKIRLFILMTLSATGMGGIYVMMIALPILLPRYYDASPLEVGLAMMPMGIMSVIGALIGGKVADRCSVRFGRGARLIPLVIGQSMAGLGVMVFGYAVDKGVYYPIIIIAVVGFFRAFQQPAMLTFAIEQMPKQASAVNAGIAVGMFTWSTVVVTASSFMEDSIGYAWWLFVLGWMMVGAVVPAFIVMLIDFRKPPLSRKMATDVTDEVQKPHIPYSESESEETPILAPKPKFHVQGKQNEGRIGGKEQ